MEPVRCQQCGASLQSSGSNAGCLNCLLLAGLTESPNESNEAHRYQHYQLCLGDDGVSAQELGRGAMGITYRATDVNLDSPVALKVINARYSSQAEARERFRREARTAARLRHPNVASVFHFGETPAGQCFYAMELVEGETLEAKVGREGPLSASFALEIAIQITRALVAAEAEKLVHRDLKPSNVMLARSEEEPESIRVKVIDFGLAKAVAEMGESAVVATRFSGTPGFASPEQLRADPLDMRSDIYSLGATLHYALTGAAPTDSLPTIKAPAQVVQLLREMLSPLAAARPASAQALLVRLQKARNAIQPQRRFRTMALVGSIVLLLALASYGLTRRLFPSTASSLHKTIAVLPFKNLSDDKENAYFADGIQDDVLTSLAKIKELTVISRASVMAYSSHPGQSLRQIARTLGVDNLLEGSVRRAGDRVIVDVRLFDAKSDHALWAEHYDRALVDTLGLQGELASEIAGKLHATLTLQERARIERKPTGNANAYVAYLRGLASERWAEISPETVQEAGRSYREAVRLDPEFGLAWARLAICDSNLYFLAFDRTPERLAAAQEASTRALKLGPDLGEAQLAQGYYRYYGLADFPAARRAFEQAQLLLPNSAEVLLAISFLDRRQGRWKEAQSHQEEASRLDPRDPVLLAERALTYLWLGQFAAARAMVDRALELTPGDAELVATKAISYQAEGNLKAAEELLASIPLQPNDSRIFDTQMLQLLYQRSYEPAIAALKSALANPAPALGQNIGNYYVLLALAQERTGDREGARATATEGRARLEKLRRSEQDSEYITANLAFLQAILGDTAATLREIENTAKLTEKDAVLALTAKIALAEVQAQFGERGAAMEALPNLLEKPHAGLISRTPLTRALLRLDPIWDPVRNDPRFRELAAEPEPAIPEKSLAVLPFENLSAEQENAFFAAGIQDEILSNLAKIADLKVISRTSVMQYAGGRPRNLREIGRALGVANILEGSVQRSANRVRVSAQLIDASTDTHLWAETFDGDLADVFGIQSQIAQRIAEQLRGKISPAQKAAIFEPPTSDLTAYTLYSEAKSLSAWSDWKDWKETGPRVKKLLAEAIRLDPNFINAYCLLGESYSHDYGDVHFTGKDSEAIEKPWKETIDRALHLRPDLGQPHLALARYHLFTGNFAASGSELAIARRLLPNDADALFAIARLERRENRWEDSLANVRKAHALDPHNAFIAYWMTDHFALMRRYAEGERFIQETIPTLPEIASGLRRKLAWLRLDQGDLKGAQEILQQIGENGGGAVRYLAALYARDYETAARILATTPAAEAEDAFNGIPPRSLSDGLLALARGDRAMAQAAFSGAREDQENRSAPSHRDEFYFTQVAVLDAGLGRKEEAIREGTRAVELLPVSKDALYGPMMMKNLAEVYTLLDEREKAVGLLEVLAKIPSDVKYGDLRFNPEWDSLRGDPRFEKVVASLRANLPDSAK